MLDNEPSLGYISIGEPGFEYEHLIGDDKYQSGWCNSGYNYPKRMSCGGLLHAEFGDENEDCDYWLYTKCDKCGLSEYEHD